MVNQQGQQVFIATVEDDPYQIPNTWKKTTTTTTTTTTTSTVSTTRMYSSPVKTTNKANIVRLQPIKRRKPTTSKKISNWASGANALQNGNVGRQMQKIPSSRTTGIIRQDSNISTIHNRSGLIALPPLPKDLEQQLELLKNKHNISPNMPTCKNEDYVLTPPMSDLEKLTDDQLKSVENFVIEHKKFGKIKFRELVDLTNVDIDVAIVFGDQQIQIYDEEDKKPQPGDKLNTTVECQLYNVRPRKKDVRKFERKLQKHCAQNNLEFVEYNPKEFIWTFIVNPHN